MVTLSIYCANGLILAICKFGPYKKYVKSGPAQIQSRRGRNPESLIECLTISKRRHSNNNFQGELQSSDGGRDHFASDLFQLRRGNFCKKKSLLINILSHLRWGSWWWTRRIGASASGGTPPSVWSSLYLPRPSPPLPLDSSLASPSQASPLSMPGSVNVGHAEFFF